MRKFIFLIVFFVVVLIYATNAKANEIYWSFSYVEGSTQYATPSAGCSARAAELGVNFYGLSQRYNSPGGPYYQCWKSYTSSYGNIYRVGTECPAGTVENTESGICEAPPCSNGSVEPQCAVECPALQYTYSLQGVIRRGTMSEGHVGYGQSCPQPHYPSGAQDACIATYTEGQPNPCADFAGAVEETDSVTETTVTETIDGDTKTTTTTTETKEGQSSTTTNTGSIDGTVKDSRGEVIEKDDPTKGYATTVNIGEETYGVCDHGGVVNGGIGCDYIPGTCAAGQVYSYPGECINIPKPDIPAPKPKETKTVELTDPVTGEKSTITVEVEGGGGGKAGEGEEQKPEPCQPDMICKDDLGNAVSGDVFTKTQGLTYEKVLGDFQAAVSTAPVIEAVTTFFSYNDSGSCPTWSVNAWVFNFTIDQFCDPRIPWGAISGILMAVSLLVAGRIAFT